MKKSVFIFGLLLSFDALAGVPSCGENCTYTLVQNNEDNDNPTYTLKVMPVDVSKPAQIKDYDREGIWGHGGEYAPWRFEPVTEVKIEEGITSVGDFAFVDMSSIQKATLPEGLEGIGNAAFHVTSISEIDLPSTLITIEGWAFSDAPLEKINGSLEKLTTIGTNALGMSKITDFVIPLSMTDMAQDAFGLEGYTVYQSKNLTNLYCPEALATQCEAAIAYRGDAAQVTSYDYKGGVYVIKDSEGNEAYYVSPDNMKNGQMCEGTLSECKKQALISRGICSGSDCDALVAADDGGYLLKVGSKTYQNINALLKGNYDKRRIYTIEEANFVAGDKNRVSIKYR